MLDCDAASFRDEEQLEGIDILKRIDSWIIADSDLRHTKTFASLSIVELLVTFTDAKQNETT
jgi:hypothetical protein